MSLETDFNSFHQFCCAKYNLSTAPGAFRGALRDLEGSFVTITAGNVNFLNPSVRDFLGKLLAREPERCLDAISSADRFIQIASLWKLGEADATIKALFEDHVEKVCTKLKTLLVKDHIRWKRDGAAVTGTFIDYGRVAKLEFLIDLLDVTLSNRIASLVEAAFRLIFENEFEDLGTVSPALRLMEKIGENTYLRANDLISFYTNLLKESVFRLLDNLDAEGWAYLLESLSEKALWSPGEIENIERVVGSYVSEGIDAEYLRCDGIEQAEEMRSNFEKISAYISDDISRTISRLEERIASLSEPEPADDDFDDERWEQYRQEQADNDNSIRELFSTLLD